MAFNKITDLDRQGKGNVGLPDTPALTTTEMQEQMDSLANLMIDKFNEFIDALNAASAAYSVGASVPSGISAQANVQSILDAMVLNLNLNTNARHTHANKNALDSISDLTLAAYNRLVTLLSTIVSVENSVLNNNTSIPTGGAVIDYINNFDMRSKILAAAWPVGSVYSTRSNQSPTVTFGGNWNLIDTDSYGVSRYVRIS